LLFCRGTAPHASYLFKHALVQDAAYSTLLRARRQELHERVAAALEEHFADLVERQPELLAHHLTAAGNTERAVDQWLKAGRYAAGRLAYLEAIVHFERGLGLLHSLPESPRRNESEIELQLALGLCQHTAKGAAEAKPTYTRAHELAEKGGKPQQRFEALYGVWQATSVSGGIAAAGPLSERLLRMAEEEGDDGLRLQAHHSAWSTWAFAGDQAKAREHADAGRLIYDPMKHASHRFVYGGHDPGVCAENVGAQVEWLLGYPEKALASIADALALAERIAHPFTLSLVFINSSVVHLNRHEPERALRQLEGAELLAAEQRLSLVYEPGMLRGVALLAQGAVDEAIARIREGITKWTRLGRTFYLPYGLAFLAEGLARQGDRAAALAALREGLGTADATRALLGCGTVPPYRDGAARRKPDRRGPGLPSASDPYRPGPASEIAGIARRNEPCPAVGRAGPAGGSARSAGTRLRLVHRGLRHPRSCGGGRSAVRAGRSNLNEPRK
jgi:tetratricopeptide (TPR) repeat protein